MKIILQKETHALCKPGMIEVSKAEASRLYALGVAKPVSVKIAEPVEEAEQTEPVKKRKKKG